MVSVIGFFVRLVLNILLKLIGFGVINMLFVKKYELNSMLNNLKIIF